MRLLDYAPRPAQLRWLLDSDPAIRWQVMKDLTDAAPMRLLPSGLALQPKVGDLSFSPSSLPPVTGVGRSGTLSPSILSLS